METIGSKQVYANPWLDGPGRFGSSVGRLHAIRPPQRELEEQDLRSAWGTRADVERMMNAGTVSDAKSTAAYALLFPHRRTCTPEQAGWRVGSPPVL